MCRGGRHTECACYEAESELQRDLFVLCMSCGRILYLAADAAKVDEHEHEDAED